MSQCNRCATGAAATHLSYVALKKPKRNGKRSVWGGSWVRSVITFGAHSEADEGHGGSSCSLLTIRKQRAREEVCEDKLQPLEVSPVAHFLWALPPLKLNASLLNPLMEVSPNKSITSQRLHQLSTRLPIHGTFPIQRQETKTPAGTVPMPWDFNQRWLSSHCFSRPLWKANATPSQALSSS